MRTIKFLSVALILIVGMILTFQGCQKDVIEENKTTKTGFNLEVININDFINNEKVSSSNGLISKYYDYNISRNNNRSEVPVSNFIILTDEISHLVGETSETFTFQIKTPTDSGSTFENFIVDVRESKNLYFLAKIIYNNNGTKFPYTVSTESISEEDINLADFENYNMPEYPDEECIVGWVVSPRDFEADPIFGPCPDGGGSDGGGSDGGNDSDTGGSSDGNDNDYDFGNGTGDNTTGNYVGGDGSSSGSGSSYSGPSYWSPTPSVQTNAKTFLNHYEPSPDGNSYFSSEVMDWIMENANNSVFKGLDQFLDENNDSPEALEFAVLAVNDFMSYNTSNYPGIDLGYPYKWWEDSSFIENSDNFDLPSDIPNNPNEVPNSAELFLFSLFPSQAIIHVANANTALTKAEELAVNLTFGEPDYNASLNNGKSDAFRHAFWNANDTADIGAYITELFTTAHEYGHTGLSSEMDLFNNEVGINLATWNSWNIFTSTDTISQSIISTVLVGETVYIKNGAITPTNL